MIRGLAQAIGAPCPTLVLDLRELPADGPALTAALTAVRTRLVDRGAGHVLKIALVAPSVDPDADLDYRFIQALPGSLDRFDMLGSCGHSILCAVALGVRRGGIGPPDRGRPIRVRVLNNGDLVTCTSVSVDPPRSVYDVEFLDRRSVLAADLLLTGRPVDELDVGGGRYAVSMVSMGNPYVFCAADSLGAATSEALFAAGADLAAIMELIRTAAADRLGLPPTGAFPKVAVVGDDGPGRVFVRALSIPSWHPTLALTGATCLAAATTVRGSIPHRALAPVPPGRDHIDVRTPGATLQVHCRTSETASGPRLSAVGLRHKAVSVLPSAFLQRPADKRHGPRPSARPGLTRVRMP